MPLAYNKFGTTSFASVGLSVARSFFWLADSDAIKCVSSDRHTFQKNVAEYEIINIYGGNVVSIEGSDWKRHRSVAMSAFNEASCFSFPLARLIWYNKANITLVWSETLHVVEEWLEQLDVLGSDIAIDLTRSMTQVRDTAGILGV